LLSPEHFAGRHITGAQNACVFQVSFLDDLAVAAPDKIVPVVVYGASMRCQDAAIALEKMDRAGYEHVTFLKFFPKAAFTVKEAKRKMWRLHKLLVDTPYDVDRLVREDSESAVINQ